MAAQNGNDVNAKQHAKPTICILTFTNDLASMNERSQLLQLDEFNFKETDKVFDNYKVLISDRKEIPKEMKPQKNIYLLQTDIECIHAEHIDVRIAQILESKPDLLVFATKHQSKSGIHSLSCHTQGNWGKAEYGGKDTTLGICPAHLLSKTFLELKKINAEMNLGYDVIIECTHHGPDLNTPSMFIEIGSDEDSWKRIDAGIAIAKVIFDVLRDYDPVSHIIPEFENLPIAIGIGGLHHCPEFTKKIERKEAIIGHVCPKYANMQLNDEMINQALDKCVPKGNLILLDWKGMVDKERLTPIIGGIAEERGIRVVKTKSLSSTSTSDSEKNVRGWD